MNKQFDLSSLWQAFAVILIVNTTPVVLAAPPPTLHIVLEGQNTSELRLIKQLRRQCITERNLYQDMRRRQPSTWAVVQQDLRRKRPGFDPDRALAPEPDWSKMAIVREEEFFDGERYAQYKSTDNITIVEDGSCRLNVEKKENARIDDGAFGYQLNLTQKRGTKYPRSSTVREIGQANLSNALRNNPGLAAATGDTLLKSGAPQAATVLKPTASGTDSVLGQSCDYFSAPSTGNAMICYWSTMHEYPSSTPRPIILKAVVPFGKDQNIQQAVLFETGKSIPSSVFRPPTGIAIQDRSSLR